MKELLTIQKYLQKLDIEPEATRVYIELAKLGPASALQLAKATSISRTQIYRHLDALRFKGLVSAEELSYGTLFRALAIENVEGLLAQKESEIAAIKRNISAMSQLLQQLAGTAGPKATIQHYYGIGGLKQVNWNLTKADGEFRVFEAAHLSQHLDRAFARRCRERCMERKLTSYDLTNAMAVTAAEIEPYDPAHTNIRHIDAGILKLDFEIYIYNDVVTLLDYGPDEQLAIEIHHPSLHAMMRQMYEAMWQLGQPLKINA